MIWTMQYRRTLHMLNPSWPHSSTSSYIVNSPSYASDWYFLFIPKIFIKEQFLLKLRIFSVGKPCKFSIDYASISSSLKISYQVTLFHNINTVITFITWVKICYMPVVFYSLLRLQSKLVYVSFVHLSLRMQDLEEWKHKLT